MALFTLFLASICMGGAFFRNSHLDQVPVTSSSAHLTPLGTTDLHAISTLSTIIPTSPRC
jgi:hypothetical protein